MAADAVWQRQLADNAQLCRNLRDRVAGIRVAETSRDGMVRVMVDANGQVTDLVLTERRQVPLAYVSAQIMECMRRAQARIPDLVRQAMLDTVGVRDAGSQLILAGVRDRFPDVPDSDARGHAAAPPPVRPARVTREHNDEYWGDLPIMEAIERDGR